MAESIGSDDSAYRVVEDWTSIAPALAELPERARHALRLRFVDDLTQSEIGERLGVSQMHVSRIIRHALTDLREAAPLPAT